MSRKRRNPKQVKWTAEERTRVNFQRIKQRELAQKMFGPIAPNSLVRDIRGVVYLGNDREIMALDRELAARLERVN